MSSIAPLLPPLDADRSALLDRLVQGLEPEALHWLSGYVAGLARARVAAPGAVSAEREPRTRATILYGSQTGNARRIAERLHQQLGASGLPARLVSTADYRPRDLAGESLVFLLVSTHGEGEPPDDARVFSEFLLGKRAPQLPNLAFAVFGLGDSSYPRFCQTARQLDERLAELGAQRLVARVEADVDFDLAAGDWLQQAERLSREKLGEARTAVVRELRSVRGPALAVREAPAEVEVLTNQPITMPAAIRAVHHLELALPAGAFPYEPGDALGVRPHNPATAVERVLKQVGADAEETLSLDGTTRPLGEWLGSQREITRLTRPFLLQHASRARQPALTALLENGNEPALREFLHATQLPDLLEACPADWTAAELVSALRPLAPRLYSIASSRAAVGDEAHLAVAVVEAPGGDGQRQLGAASHFLANLQSEARIQAYLEPNPRFRLPEDGSTDLIMIGAGTGIAPYRGFLQQRLAQGASGRHWLVFGGRHLRSDFLYQAEWLDALRRGELTRLDVAFSRDQPEKRYVQHALLEQGAEIHAWLEGGARLYVCGDAERMAPDVDKALAAIIASHGGRSAEQAREYLQRLAAERRYLRDVY